MSDKLNSEPGPGQPAVYEIEIRIKGHLDSGWANWFGSLAITPEDNGVTTLAGTVADQAALHGLLRKVRDLGMTLVSVNCVAYARDPGAGAIRVRHSKE